MEVIICDIKFILTSSRREKAINGIDKILELILIENKEHVKIDKKN